VNWQSLTYFECHMNRLLLSKIKATRPLPPKTTTLRSTSSLKLSHSIPPITSFSPTVAQQKLEKNNGPRHLKTRSRYALDVSLLLLFLFHKLTLLSPFSASSSALHGPRATFVKVPHYTVRVNTMKPSLHMRRASSLKIAQRFAKA
jgi:hypothetical protein